MLVRALMVLLIGFSAGCPSPTVASEIAIEAQASLATLGYFTGKVDGNWGPKGEAALAAFLKDQGKNDDGKLDATDASLLAAAAAPYEIKLTNKGRIFDLDAARSTSCNNLGLGRFDPAVGIKADQFPPILAFDDSASIGSSAEANSFTTWGKTVTVLSAAAATEHNDVAGNIAKEMLLSWAKAGAGLGTRVDARYLGAGNAKNYDPEAAAPVLDMQNAQALGGVGVVASVFLADRLSADELALVRDWSSKLIQKYDRSAGTISGSTGGLFIDYYPALLGAVANGDAEKYRTIVSSLYRLIRDRVDAKGAILKNADRGDRAVSYQSVGLLAIMSTIEIVEAQGGKVPPDIENKLHLAVKFLLVANRDNRVILPYAKAGYNNPGRGVHMEATYLGNGDHYWWMVDYLARYPDTDNSRRIRVLLANNDTYERVDKNILASTFIPYPINCFRSFDMTPAAVESARAFVKANYPAVELPPVGGFAKGMPALKAAVPLTFGTVAIIKQDNQSNFRSFNVLALNVKAGSIHRDHVAFQVWTDFTGGSDLRNLDLFRIVIPSHTLNSSKDAAGKYAACGEVAADRSDNGEMLVRLHIGNNAETNSCILNNMAKDDRVLWSSVLADLEAMINTAGRTGSKDAAELKSIFRQMVY